MKLLYLSFILFLSSHYLAGQERPLQHAAPYEAHPASGHLFLQRTPGPSVSTNAPNYPVRSMAEWEEVQALCISWHSRPAILKEIARYAQEECDVIIFCSDSTAVKSYLQQSPSVSLQRIRFLQKPTNTIWMRDYGSVSIYKYDVDSLMLVDWQYNRANRIQDDEAPFHLADFIQLPLFSTSGQQSKLTNVGGNFMTDGLGRGFSSELVLQDNPQLSEAQIDQRMRDFMGIHQYIKMPTLPFDGIHHIDMHLKLLDEETLLVGEYPDGVADGPQIEANLQYILQQYHSYFGKRYEVIRIPMPPDQYGRYPDQGGFYRTYTNSVFINKTLLVPLYEERYDTTALRILEEALPGYKIRGIDCNSLIPALGAIHCITKGVGDDDPLLIVHEELDAQAPNFQGYLVEAEIRYRSPVLFTRLHYRLRGSTQYQSVSMAHSNHNMDIWSATIPPQPDGSIVEYYIEAHALGGKIQRRPITAPDGFWSFRVDTQVNTQGPQRETQCRLFPNPANAITCLQLDLSHAVAQAQLRLFDVLGRPVQELYRGSLAAGEQRFFLQAQDLAPGSYWVEILLDEQRLTKKLVVY